MTETKSKRVWSFFYGVITSVILAAGGTVALNGCELLQAECHVDPLTGELICSGSITIPPDELAQFHEESCDVCEENGIQSNSEVEGGT